TPAFVSSCSPTGACGRCGTPFRARPSACWRTGTTASPSRASISRLRAQEKGETTMCSRTCCRSLALALLFLTALASAGCGPGRYPVSGRVTYPDGSPVEAGTVIGEATVNGKLVGVQGTIAKDGHFRWGTEKPGDGAFPGNYRIVV